MHGAGCRPSCCAVPHHTSRPGHISSIQLGLSRYTASIRRWQQHCSSICYRVIPASTASGQQPVGSQAAAGSPMDDPCTAAGASPAAAAESVPVESGMSTVGMPASSAVGGAALAKQGPLQQGLGSSWPLTDSGLHTELAMVDMAAFTEAMQAATANSHGSSPGATAGGDAARSYRLPEVANVPAHCRAAYQHALNVLAKAAHQLQQGHVVAVPTETVYGLAADACNPAAVGRIFAAKGRPQDNPLIVHVSDLDMLQQLYPGRSLQDVMPPLYWPLIEDLWPGPLTLLLPASPVLAPGVSAGQPTVAVRMPSHPLARALIHASGVPLAAPSANISGRPSPTTGEHVMADLAGRIPLVVDGGPAGVGLESTVLDGLRDPPAVLRPGGVTREVIASYPGLSHCGVYAVTFTDPQLEAHPTTPGMKYRHYSPSTPLVLLEPPTQSKEWPPPGWTQWVEGQVQSQHQACGLGCNLVVMRTTLPLGTPVGWVGAEPCKRTESPRAPTLMSASGHGSVYQYCLGNNSEQVAHNLFAALREVDGCGVAVMIVEGCVPEGAGLAVMNRLRKAATSIVAAK